MPIEVTTVYTKECLLRYQKYFISRRKAFWIILAVMEVFALGVSLCNGILWGDFSLLLRGLLLLFLIDAVYIFNYVIYPRISVNKAKNLNAQVRFSFEEECFHMYSSNALFEENSTIQYTMPTKIYKKGNDLYIFIAQRSAYIADLSSLSDGEKEALRTLLQPNFKPKNFKWA
ncbi:MAG: YcxB family protein [Clostridia bacterium]|nr:YcxB family protein [Clostridia bacterium]